MDVGVYSLCLLSLVASLTLFVQVSGVIIGDLPTEQHEVSGILSVLNPRTLSFTKFNYDGNGPGAFLYYYRPGQAVDRTGRGIKIPLPSSVGTGPDGRFQRRRFTNEDFTVTLPEGTDVCDIGTLTVWCEPFQAIFTRIEIKRNIFVNDGNDPCTLLDGDSPVTPENYNCIPLHETLQLSWRVDRNNSQVSFRLCGCQKPGTNQYMGFGLSADPSRTLMFGADPTIAWVDSSTGEANAVDYYLSAYSQCRSGEGACPDEITAGGQCTNDVTNITGFVRSGQQCVTFTRQFSTSDSTCDITIDPTNEEQYIVWGVGSLGVTAFKHFTRAEPNDPPINLGRTPPVDECANEQLVCETCEPFKAQCIIARESTTFQARIGPSGNERGYLGITGRVGWGIAWYIDGVLVPELVVERGKTYTFSVEGGNTPSMLEIYHPFYITNSIGGGRIRNTPEEQANETVYAGFFQDNPTAVGRLCQYMETAESETLRQQCNSYDKYFSSLQPSDSCNSGQPGALQWTPDENTPDTVYYQCATHLNLGWKITVLNAMDPDPLRCDGVTVYSGSLFLATVLASLSIFTFRLE